MSTRATYLFPAGEYRPAVCLYIHHDGYPTGAAGLYLLPAIEKAGGHLTVEAFIRANERAEITPSHEAHGDTEYRYTIDLDNGTVKVDGRTHDWKSWRCEWFGNIADFINQHGQEFRPGVQVKPRHGYQRACWMTAEMAKAYADEKTAYAKSYREQHPQFVGNADYADREAREAAEFAAQFDAQQAAA